MSNLIDFFHHHANGKACTIDGNGLNQSHRFLCNTLVSKAPCCHDSHSVFFDIKQGGERV
jgi:hypothetical protein